MVELSGVHVKITADASDLKTEVAGAATAVGQLGSTAQTAQARTGGLTGAFGKLATVSSTTRARIQNASFQISDIAVQLQGGTKASTAFAQQLPQLLGGFGALGAVLGVVAGIGIPALALAFGSLGGSTETLEKRLETLKASMDTMDATSDILKMSVYELRDAYGEAAERVRAFAVVQAELSAAQAASRMSEQVDILRDAAGAYTNANNAGRDYANTIARIGRDFGLAKTEAQQFETLLENVNNAGTFEDQQYALQKVLEFLDKNNVELAKMPPELQRAISEMITFSNETDRARAIMQQLSAEAANVTVGVGLSPDDPNLLPPSDTDPDKKTKTGAARVNPLIAELESVRQSLLTQEQLQIGSYARQQETLKMALEQKLLTLEEYNAFMQEAQTRHSDAMQQIDGYRYGTGLQKASNFFGEMAGALQSGNSKLAAIGKKFAIAQGITDGISAAISAWDKGMKAGGPAVAAAYTGLSLLRTGAMLSQLKSGGSGGSTSGGGTSAATAQAAAPQPLQVSLNTFGGGEFIRRDSLGELFAMINSGTKNGYVINVGQK